MSAVEELKLDVAELENLLKQATRQKVKDILGLEMRKLQTAIIKQMELQKADEAKADDTEKEPKEKQTPSVTVARKVCKHTKDLDSYGWDQSDKFMKIYVTLNGVQKLEKEKIKSDFTERTFKLQVYDLDSKDYRLSVVNLSEDIIPSESYHKIKTDMVLLMLKKSEQKKTWPYVTLKDKKAKEPAKKPEKADPEGGLMDMLKQMYDDGDEEMKRTIAKAWSESRDKNPGMV